MRRLIQVGLMLLVAASVALPVLEWLDRWDTAGLSNDGEFAVFALVFCLSLVLLLCRLFSLPADMTGREVLPFFPPSKGGPGEGRAAIAALLPTTSVGSPPLRI